MHREEIDDENDEGNGDDGSGLLSLLLGALGIGLVVAPVLAPSGSVTYQGGNTGGDTDGSKIVPLPSPPSPAPVAVHLPSPLLPSRRITPHGYFGAPRYIARFLRWSKSSATPIYPGQTPDHNHGGIDLPGADGENVLAVEDGTLNKADPGPYGQPGAVALVGSGGRRWAYIHVHPVGELPREVHTGDVVARIGGDHLHLQLTIAGVLTDPAGFF